MSHAKPATTRRLRTAAAAALIAIAVASACGAVVAWWTDDVLFDTDTFITAIEPVVRDEAVREGAATTISDRIIDALGVRELARSLVPGEDTALADEIADGFEGFVRITVGTAVATETFTDLWLADMRRWHLSLVAAVRTPQDATLEDSSALDITLGPYIDLLFENAEDTFVNRLLLGLVPDSARQLQVTVFDASVLEDRVMLARHLEAARPYLPWIAAATFLLALVAAPRTGYALLASGIALSVAAGATVRAVSVESGRVASLVRSVFSASPESAGRFVDTLAGPLASALGYLVLAGAAAAILGGIVAWRARSATM